MTMTLNGSGTGTVGVPNSATAQNSTSGTSITFTGIPSGTKMITIVFQGVSTNGTANLLVQIGSGSTTSSGYISTGNSYNQANATGGASSTAGFLIFSNAATDTTSGTMTLCLITGNTWVSSHSVKGNTTAGRSGGGDVSLSGTLDRVVITTTNGTDVFDAGVVNIIYQ